MAASTAAKPSSPTTLAGFVQPASLPRQKPRREQVQLPRGPPDGRRLAPGTRGGTRRVLPGRALPATQGPDSERPLL